MTAEELARRMSWAHEPELVPWAQALLGMREALGGMRCEVVTASGVSCIRRGLGPSSRCRRCAALSAADALLGPLDGEGK